MTGGKQSQLLLCPTEVQLGLQVQSGVWQYMKESDTLANNATVKQLKKDVLPVIKGKHMKELTILTEITLLSNHTDWSC